MHRKFDFVKGTKLSTGTTLIKFGENVELTAVYMEKFEYEYHCFKIENPKLNFEITKISYTSYFGEECDITNRYDKSKKTFVTITSPNLFTYTFYISANIQLKPDHFAIYQLRIPGDEFKNLKKIY